VTEYGTRLRAYHVGSGLLRGVLTHPLSTTLSVTESGLPDLKIDYLAGTERAGWLEDIIANPIELAWEWYRAGTDTWVEPDNARFLVLSGSDDPQDGTGKRSYHCGGYGWLLAGCPKWTPTTSIPPAAKPVRVFTGQTVGSIIKLCIDDGKTRGWAPNLTYGFTATVDSNGVAWPTTFTIQYPIKTTLDSILQGFINAGTVEVEWRGRELRMYVPGTLGTDLTTGPRKVRYRHGITAAPVTTSYASLASIILGVGDDGTVTESANAGAVTPYGPLGAAVETSGTSDPATLAVLMTLRKKQGKNKREQIVYEWDSAHPSVQLPFLDYTLADRLPVERGRAGLDNAERFNDLRVVSFSITSDRDGIRGHTVFADKLEDVIDRMLRRVQLLSERSG